MCEDLLTVPAGGGGALVVAHRIPDVVAAVSASTVPAVGLSAGERFATARSRRDDARALRARASSDG
jgi:hypothetical protein